MDFSSLARRELQALCKKNKLPANLTNVAMADSLKALELVEGLEEFLNQSKTDPQQSPEKTMKGSLSISRTTGRTSTRRKPINEEPESSQPMTQSRRGTRRAVSDEMDQEKTEVPKTPAAPSTRRRAPAASARQKTETQKEKPSMQSVYNTRRSVRLLEKNMSKLSLDYENNMPFKMDELSSEINNGSEKSDGSASVDKGSYMQTGSESSSERVDVSEVSSEPKSNEPLENEGQLKDVVHENSMSDIIEVGDDSKSKSEMESEISESKSISDVIVVSVVMDESHEEGSDEADDKEPHDEETEKSLAVKVSNDVSAEVMEDATAAQSSFLPEAKESPSEDPEDECQSLEIKESDINAAAEDQDFENGDADSKSATLGETEEVKEVANIEDAAKPDALTLSLTGEQINALSSKDSNMYGAAKDDYNEKFDFESESDSSTEEGSVDDIDSYEIEAMDDIPSESQDKESGDMKAGEGNISFEADSSTEEDSEDSADDNSEEESSEDEEESSENEMPSSGEKMSPHHLLAAHEESPHPENLMPSSVKKMMSPHHRLAAHEETPHSDNLMAKSETPTLPPLAADTLSLQFPRPSVSKSGKSSGSEIMNYIFDDNEENIDSSDKTVDLGLGGVEMKKDEAATNKDITQKSLRQLKKMLKAKLTIGDNKMINTEDKNGGKKMMVEKPRTALQEVPENQMAMAVNKPGKAN